MSVQNPESAQQTRDIETVLGRCWAAVYDGGPTVGQHWFNGCVWWVSRLTSTPLSQGHALARLARIHGISLVWD